MSLSCRSFRSYLAYNSPAVICPASCIFSLCTHSLLVSSRLKGTSMPISEVLFLHSSLLSSTLPHTLPAAPALSNSDLCLLDPMTQLCSVRALPTSTELWKKAPLGRGSFGIVGLTSFISAPTFITVVPFPPSNACKQLLHIFCPDF